MLILGIESSCDETGAAVVEDGQNVLSNTIASSVADFQKTGGVIPEYAARRQVEWMIPVIEKALKSAKVEPTALDAIAVTYGPGLLGSLLVGTATARVLCEVWGKPLVPVHHTLGHLSSTFLGTTGPIAFPLLTLSVSGGHTDLWYRTAHTQGQKVGTTLDDAAGEAFDKGAAMLGLAYPGGPLLAKLADSSDESSYSFPDPLQGNRKEIAFSFSGLKTSLKYLLRDVCKKEKCVSAEQLSDDIRKNVAASYQLAICRHLTKGLEEAIARYPDIREVHIVGGVSANIRLRKFAEGIAQKYNLTVRWPGTLSYCTDNAAMIAAAGNFLLMEKTVSGKSAWKTLASDDLARCLSPIESC